MKRQLHSNWREDLREVVDIPPSEPKTDKSEKRIEDKKVKNKIVINPQMTEAFEEIGGIILEVEEIEEGLFGKKKPLGPTKARYGGSKEPTKDTRMQASKADTKAKTPAAQNLAKGDKRYKMVGEDISALQTKRAREEQKIARIDMNIAKERKKLGKEAQVNEKLDMKKDSMGTVIKDFYKSDAPQFKGKSKEKKREMAIAAKLEAERGPQNEETSDKHKEAIRMALAKTMPGQKPLNKKDIAARRQETKKKEKESGVKPKIKPFPMSSRFD
jgi:hypothetical protein